MRSERMAQIVQSKTFDLGAFKQRGPTLFDIDHMPALAITGKDELGTAFDQRQQLARRLRQRHNVVALLLRRRAELGPDASVWGQLQIVPAHAEYFAAP